ncbi:hypothetical protein [Nocardia wallacei]|uniref:hypothetical protein n=1 Tax=Nocardia wallacei TaxID=480035 RepID=UPI0024587A29|nr:hypothetical protein [Nocardia wallacei]
MNNRVRLTPLDDSVPDREIYVGWDRGLGTYFAQVYDGVDADGEDVLSLDLGNEPGEIGTPDAAIEAIRPYAKIPEDLPAALNGQREAPGALERSPYADWASQAVSTPNSDDLPRVDDEPEWQGFDR